MISKWDHSLRGAAHRSSSTTNGSVLFLMNKCLFIICTYIHDAHCTLQPVRNLLMKRSNCVCFSFWFNTIFIYHFHRSVFVLCRCVYLQIRYGIIQIIILQETKKTVWSKKEMTHFVGCVTAFWFLDIFLSQFFFLRTKSFSANINIAEWSGNNPIQSHPSKRKQLSK